MGGIVVLLPVVFRFILNKYIVLMLKSKKILNRVAWFRSIRPGDVSKGKFRDSNCFKSISVQLAGYNAGMGKRLGVYVHAKYVRSEASVILVGVTATQRKKELSDPFLKDEWRKLIEK